jgi:hypothetical protein
MPPQKRPTIKGGDELHTYMQEILNNVDNLGF